MSLEQEFKSTVDMLRRQPLTTSCYLASTGIGAEVGASLGAAAGGIGAVPGAIAGAVIGLAVGFSKCDAVTEKIQKKFTSVKPRLENKELYQSIAAMKQTTGVKSDDEALFLLNLARQELSSPSGRIAKMRSSKYSPKQAAKILLSNRHIT